MLSQNSDNHDNAVIIIVFRIMLSGSWGTNLIDKGIYFGIIIIVPSFSIGVIYIVKIVKISNSSVEKWLPSSESSSKTVGKTVQGLFNRLA